MASALDFSVSTVQVHISLHLLLNITTVLYVIYFIFVIILFMFITNYNTSFILYICIYIGKSTSLAMLSGELQPSTGELMLSGQNLLCSCLPQKDWILSSVRRTARAVDWTRASSTVCPLERDRGAGYSSCRG